MKQAVILAAGRGSRLGTISNGKPKCLLKVGECTLIAHQLRQLREAGVDRICIVVGYGSDEVRSTVGDTCDYIVNQRYAKTNSLYSLWLTRKWVEASFVLLNCDVIAHPEIFQRILAFEGSTLAYDSSSGAQAEHMKVSFADNALQSISKKVPLKDSNGENVGILQFNQNDADLLFSTASELIAGGNENHWAPAAVNQIASKTSIHGIDIAGLPWTEIDFPEDLSYAQHQIWPAICNGKTDPKIKKNRLIQGDNHESDENHNYPVHRVRTDTLRMLSPSV